ncbi:tight adherence pilus pseudopilin TadF [Vibrio owensii]|uniref:tight adherence pilus pseudopilin TadF n=1 Tax=Vibrio owensii TaxID=696485 RepID=UPI0022DE19FD|nr:tight adherence pilus pseudopilin TadF [Vibrio owensii]MDA0384475.1 tight adherence pilus pseudopilin TadF [Vibrio owensii]
MRFINSEHGGMAVETTILAPVLFLALLLTMQYAASTSLKFEMSDMAYQAGEVISNRRDIFEGNLKEAEVQKLSDAFHLEERNISIIVEELAYGEVTSSRQKYKKVRINNDIEGKACDIDTSLSDITPVINAYKKFHSVYRVTLCREIAAFNTIELPEEIYQWFEVKFSSTHYGKHH